MAGPQSSAMNDAVTKFSIDLYRVLCEGSNGNTFLSPYSVSAALLLTMLGTKGNSESQIAKALCLSDISNPHEEYKKIHSYLSSKSGDGVKLAIANRVFSKLGLQILEEYKKSSLQYYGSELELLDFVGDPEGSRSRINTWVEKQTNNKIKDLIPAGGINALSLVVLTNAIYFKGDWDMAFKSSDTKKEKFHISSTESKMVDMMHMKKEEWLCGESESLKCKMLQLPYKGKGLSMLIILPNETDGLSALEKQLSVASMEEIRRNLYRQDAVVSMPKFKMECSFYLQNVLPKLGMSDVFSPGKADFSGMFREPPSDTFVSDVIHKAFIEVNEEGTEAAAATAVMMRLMCMPAPPLEFKADHPFLFLIQENTNATILFIGKLANPS